MTSLCEILSNENKEEKIKWLKSKWGYTYDRAIDISTKTNRNLWFDPRYWKTSEIKEFFEDLSYGDSRIWELIHIKLSKGRPTKAEKRFKEWKSKQ